MPEFRQETERLVLRDWTEADWPEFFRVTNTPTVMQWLGGVLDESARAALRSRVETCAALHGHCFWLVERKADGRHLSGEPLGFCGLKRADAPGSSVTGEFEIGWRLREDAWGRGYAKEAARAGLAAAFDRFAATQVVALTVIGNEPSWGLMKRLGMRRREELDYPDSRFEPPLRDTIVYSLSRDEWKR
ncbi:GNAT family N-acetyltransferase [Altererythrobacter soli]|uniref:GNAT family N-acetyltransferase n=1 Tax=Croceibacterium soli TaxID=1739690 RepID=A0A6I4UN75_9SPHN|nr:GNAT family N-acetyltransferase [Croceibacterium soli]MXP40168.1 GNAT family N-acetyltransferase [Croceibacterium soli]